MKTQQALVPVFAPNQKLMAKQMNPIAIAKERGRLADRPNGIGVPTEDLEIYRLHFEAMELFNIKPSSMERIGWFAEPGDLAAGMSMVHLLEPWGLLDRLSCTKSDGLFGAFFVSEDAIYKGYDHMGIPHQFDTMEPFEPYNSLFLQFGSVDSLVDTQENTRQAMGNMLLGEPEFQYDAVIAFFIGEVLSPKKEDLCKSIRNALRFVKPGGFFSMAFVVADKYLAPTGIDIPLALADETTVYDTVNAVEEVEASFIRVTSGVGDLRPEGNHPYQKVVYAAGVMKKH